MTVINSETFDTTSIGSLPTGWTPIGSAVWAVSNSVSISAPNSLIGPISGGDGKIIFDQTQGTRDDMEIRYDVAIVAGFVAPLLRASVDGSNNLTCYGVFPRTASALNGNWDFYKVVGGSSTRLDTFIPSGLSGNLSLRVRIQGSIVSIKVWNQGTTEPSSWIKIFGSDSSITGVGYSGFYNQGVTADGGGSGVDNYQLDDLTSSATDFTVTPSSQTTGPGNATGSYTVTPNATPSSSTVVSLSDGAAGGAFKNAGGSTIALLTFTAATAQTFTYTPPSGATSSPIILTATASGGISTTHTAQCVLNIPATNFSLSPSSRSTTVGSATSNYTVGLNGTLSSNETIALADGAAGGIFKNAGGSAITSLTFTPSDAATPQIFTYTPSSLGTQTLTASGTGQFTISHNTSCATGSGPQTLAVDNPGIFWSPGSWDTVTPSTFGVGQLTKQSANSGAYTKLNVVGATSVSIILDTTQNVGFSNNQMPILSYTVDGPNGPGAWIDFTVPPGATSMTIGTPDSNAHQITIAIKSTSSGQGDRWGSLAPSAGPTNTVRIVGFRIDAGASLVSVVLQPNRILIYGDSITEGSHSNTDGTDDAKTAYPSFLASALAAEYGQIGFSGQGYEATGGANAIPFKNTYPYYANGRSRDFAPFTHVICNHGANDYRSGVAGASIHHDTMNFIAFVRSQNGECCIIIATPASFAYDSDLRQAVTDYKAANPSENRLFAVEATSLFPPGTFNLLFNFSVGPYEFTYDGTHLVVNGAARFGAGLASKINAAAAPGTTTTSTTAYPRTRIANE
jgi:hypothetical protein